MRDTCVSDLVQHWFEILVSTDASGVDACPGTPPSIICDIKFLSYLNMQTKLLCALQTKQIQHLELYSFGTVSNGRLATLKFGLLLSVATHTCMLSACF